MTADRGVGDWAVACRRASHTMVFQTGRVAWSLAARRVRHLVVRPPGCAVIVPARPSKLLGLVGAEGWPGVTVRPAAADAAPTRPVARATVRPEYAILTGRIAGRVAAEDHGEAETIAELRNAKLDLMPLAPADPDIAAVVAEARATLDEAAASMERFLALPRSPGVLDSAVEGFTRGLAHVPPRGRPPGLTPGLPPLGPVGVEGAGARQGAAVGPGGGRRRGVVPRDRLRVQDELASTISRRPPRRGEGRG